jgi:transposase
MSNKRYADEFKSEAIKQVLERGFTVVDVAARIGVPDHTLYLYGWVQRLDSGNVPVGRSPTRCYALGQAPSCVHLLHLDWTQPPTTRLAIPYKDCWSMVRSMPEAHSW